VGLSELPRHPPTACRSGAAGAEHAGASPAHRHRPWTPIRDSLCFLPHIKGVRKVGYDGDASVLPARTSATAVCRTNRVKTCTRRLQLHGALGPES
jgi:hypothetical protein